jgi:hypothetical protein
MNIEQIMKKALDGHFYSMGVAPGIEGKAVVRCRAVAPDYIPDHRPSWLADMDGGEIHHNSLPFSPDQDEKLMQLRALGLRWRDVGIAIGRCVNNTRDRYQQICKERGIDPGPARVQQHSSKVSNAVKERAFTLKMDGLTYSQIGEKLGITKWQAADAVQQVRKRRAAA